MAHRKTLTEKQLDVLRWIDGGCPDGVFQGGHHRISAAALRNRSFITTSGRGPSWSAEITEAGRKYIAEADGPKPPVPRQANTSVTAQLVADVIAAGGSLRVPRRRYYDRDGVDYEQRARLAESYGKVPDGKRLVVTSIPPEELQIDLVDAPEGTHEEPEPVPVPRRVSRYRSSRHSRGALSATRSHEALCRESCGSSKG